MTSVGYAILALIVLIVVKTVVKELMQPTNKEYFNRVVKEMSKEFPHEFKGTNIRVDSLIKDSDSSMTYFVKITKKSWKVTDDSISILKKYSENIVSNLKEGLTGKTGEALEELNVGVKFKFFTFRGDSIFPIYISWNNVLPTYKREIIEKISNRIVEDALKK